MTMQRLCHSRTHTALVCASLLCAPAMTVHGSPPSNDYPTHARVEYVNECAAKQRGPLSYLYQCSCVIDQIATQLKYDDFVEASTFAKYASLPGEAGGVFRDSDHAKSMAKKFRDIEKNAYQSCGLNPPR